MSQRITSTEKRSRVWRGENPSRKRGEATLPGAQKGAVLQVCCTGRASPLCKTPAAPVGTRRRGQGAGAFAQARRGLRGALPERRRRPARCVPRIPSAQSWRFPHCNPHKCGGLSIGQRLPAVWNRVHKHACALFRQKLSFLPRECFAWAGTLAWVANKCLPRAGFSLSFSFAVPVFCLGVFPCFSM